jgi:hypothetical protein
MRSAGILLLGKKDKTFWRRRRILIAKASSLGYNRASGRMPDLFNIKAK